MVFSGLHGKLFIHKTLITCGIHDDNVVRRFAADINDDLQFCTCGNSRVAWCNLQDACASCDRSVQKGKRSQQIDRLGADDDIQTHQDHQRKQRAAKAHQPVAFNRLIKIDF